MFGFFQILHLSHQISFQKNTMNASPNNHRWMLMFGVPMWPKYARFNPPLDFLCQWFVVKNRWFCSNHFPIFFADFLFWQLRSIHPQLFEWVYMFVVCQNSTAGSLHSWIIFRKKHRKKCQQNICDSMDETFTSFEGWGRVTGRNSDNNDSVKIQTTILVTGLFGVRLAIFIRFQTLKGLNWTGDICDVDGLRISWKKSRINQRWLGPGLGTNQFENPISTLCFIGPFWGFFRYPNIEKDNYTKISFF